MGNEVKKHILHAIGTEKIKITKQFIRESFSCHLNVVN